MRWSESGQQTDALVFLGSSTLNLLPVVLIFAAFAQSRAAPQGQAGCWGPACSAWGWTQLPGGLSGQLNPSSDWSSQFRSLDFRLWCLQRAEVLFWYLNPFLNIRLLNYVAEI